MDSRQCIRNKKEKEEQNFNPGFALIGLSGTGPPEVLSFISMNNEQAKS